MIIRVSELPGDGLAINDAAMLGAPYRDASWRLGQVCLRVRPDGRDVLVEGTVEATIPQVCGRCVEPFTITIQVPLDARFIPKPAVVDNRELLADDLETDFYADDQIELGALIESETTLALPMRPLCRPDCKGLCPACGGNRNLVACGCPATRPDPRLTVLHDLAARLNQ